jgi:hypothetical protein
MTMPGITIISPKSAAIDLSFTKPPYHFTHEDLASYA